MQIIRPDMWGIIGGPIILFLIFLGILGSVLFYSGIKNTKKNKCKSLIVTKIVFGSLSVWFVIYNWVGYNSIFTENENLLIGEYICTETKLTINSDFTWNITGDNEYLCESGNWEYVMSEDWNYWNIQSENMKCWTQIGSPKEGLPQTITLCLILFLESYCLR
jgi:hypothetical protein